ncbi:MarR family winged helix-turn-helix transcriptional regulator [Desulfovibrio desulfuricans]|nr:MarR family winged helix-turn-helix transcriptional regulator [Desulfovibrio desulfuricans]
MQLPCLFLEVRKAERQLSWLYGKCLGQNNLRITQYGLLRAIAGLAEPSITEIGRILGIDQTTVTRNVDKLEQAGLVVCGHPLTDSRKKIVRLTPFGADSLEKAHPLWGEAQQRVVAGLGDKDVQELLRLLAKVSSIAETDCD